MNKYTILIYALIVGAAVISSIYKKMKKASNRDNYQQKKPTSTYQQPKPKPQHTQPKTLDDILKSLMDETKAPVIQTAEVKKKLVTADKGLLKSTTSEDLGTLEKMEKNYYAQDSELEFDSEIEDYDELTDHHVHGVGFDNITDGMIEDEKGEWADIDWRKALITAEILRRPEY